MDRSKQIDLIRKRNIELSQQIEDLQLHLDLNSKGYETAKDLITELENIKDKWLETLDRLYDKETEYDKLLSDMKEVNRNLSLCLYEMVKSNKS